jgi:hypothetical protein
MTWPFPPLGGPTPWTPAQVKEYARKTRENMPCSPF